MIASGSFKHSRGFPLTTFDTPWANEITLATRANICQHFGRGDVLTRVPVPVSGRHFCLLPMLRGAIQFRVTYSLISIALRGFVLSLAMFPVNRDNGVVHRGFADSRMHRFAVQ